MSEPAKDSTSFVSQWGKDYVNGTAARLQLSYSGMIDKHSGSAVEGGDETLGATWQRFTKISGGIVILCGVRTAIAVVGFVLIVFIVPEGRLGAIPEARRVFGLFAFYLLFGMRVSHVACVGILVVTLFLRPRDVYASATWLVGLLIWLFNSCFVGFLWLLS